MRDNIITIILSIVSASGVLSIAVKSILSKLHKQETRQKALEWGVQALLRDRMLYSYGKCMEQGYAPVYVRENFENMYQQYRELGGNGVMKQLHATFMDLPLEGKK